ncbi:Uncharacterised protein [Veillonella criceti]|uniref:Uncharacterized protein n=2 Tax=Veillonella criceti TaxID=103891 RepID=A0A380NIQ3_9FIRM|nr:Uncharacterised protein [Veillonella criceti]
MELLTPHKAQNFFYDVLYVTIVEQKQMTEVAELCELATTFGIPREIFLKTYASETVELALLDDLKLCEMYAIRALPSYLIEYNKKTVSC